MKILNWLFDLFLARSKNYQIFSLTQIITHIVFDAYLKKFESDLSHHTKIINILISSSYFLLNIFYVKAIS